MEKRTKKILNEKAKSTNKSNTWNKHEQTMARKPAIRPFGHSLDIFRSENRWLLPGHLCQQHLWRPLPSTWSNHPVESDTNHEKQILKMLCSQLSSDHAPLQSCYNFRLRESIYFVVLRFCVYLFVFHRGLVNGRHCDSCTWMRCAHQKLRSQTLRNAKKMQATSHTSSCAVVLTC